MQYLQDYDETYPLCYFAYKDSKGQDTSWETAVFPYIKSGRLANGNGGVTGAVFSCPSFPDSDQGAQFHVRQDLFPGYWSTNYVAGTLSDVSEPAGKILIWEGGQQGFPDWWDKTNNNNGNAQGTVEEYAWLGSGGITAENNGTVHAGIHENGNDIFGDCDMVSPNHDWWGQCNAMPRYRHSGMANFIYLDGHSKAIPRKRLNFQRDIFIGKNEAGQKVNLW